MDLYSLLLLREKLPVWRSNSKKELKYFLHTKYTKMLDLYNQQYDRETLKKYIYAVSLIDILKTQKIDATFAVRYLLNPNYQLKPEESILTPKIVLHYQTHISEEELLREIIDYESDDDSVANFDEYLTPSLNVD